MKVQVEEVNGYDCYTNFHGMDTTRDRLCSLVKKWHSLIEAFVQAKTADGYLVRMFSIAFTRKHKHQVKATCYAKASQQKQLRQKMMEIMVAEIQKNSLKELFKKLSGRLDQLFAFHASALVPEVEIAVKKNIPAVQMEEAMPTTMTTADRLAPEEIYAPRKGERQLAAREELSQDERKAGRRRKKRVRRRSPKPPPPALPSLAADSPPRSARLEPPMASRCMASSASSRRISSSR